jgi:hypothetical protein
MASVLKSAVRMWRTLAGEEPAIERLLTRHYRDLRSRIERKYTGDNYICCWSRTRRERRIGIYVRGSCDLVAILFCQPLLHPMLQGTCCLIRDGSISDSRSDLLLQGLHRYPQEWLDPVIAKLKLPADYFQPRFFEQSFCIQAGHGRQEFPKTVIFLSIAADVARTVYRHRQHGFLIDPGEWWFGQSVQSALADLSTATWFWENFVSVGRIGVDAFQDNMWRLVNLLKQHTGAHILVFNMLTGDAHGPTRPAQTSTVAPQARRRDFNVALAELAHKLDFAVVDVDRLLKTAGIAAQLESLQFPPERDEPVNEAIFRIIAQEAFQMMRELEVF